MIDVIAQILSVFQSRGGEKYADEVVTQQEHALQCACLARAENACDAMVAAALLHDIGHILGHQDLPLDCEINLDDDHEQVGCTFLETHFIEHVTEPVRLHVAAKRYLSTTKPEYINNLSPTSFKSFLDQGGRMNEQELKQFELESFFEEAVRLRAWDDQAKMLENPAVQVKDFVPQLDSVLREKAATN